MSSLTSADGTMESMDELSCWFSLRLESKRKSLQDKCVSATVDRVQPDFVLIPNVTNNMVQHHVSNGVISEWKYM